MSSKATRNSLVALAALACLLPMAVQAGWDAHAPEKAFRYRGKPINPRCVTQMAEPDTKARLDLARCTKPGKIEQEDGEFTVNDTTEQTLSAAYDLYKVLAHKGGRFVVSSSWSGGGTGKFTELLVLQRNGGNLSLEKEPAGGDRCNGGLDDIEIQGHHVVWIEHNTPADLVELGGLKTLKAYKDLEASAGSCVAERNMEYDLDTGFVHMASVSLDGAFEDHEGWTENYTYQHCFNAYLKHFVASSGADLDEDGVKLFSDGFASACLAKKP